MLVFHRKDLCEAKPKMQSVFKFSDNLSALNQMDPCRWGFRPGWLFVRYSGQLDLSSDIPPQDELWVRMTFVQMYPPGRDILWASIIWLQIRLTFGETYPRWGFRSGWPLVRCTSQDEASGQVNIWSDIWSGWPLVCTPWQRHLMAKSDTTSGQADLWSDIPPYGWGFCVVGPQSSHHQLSDQP